MAEKAFIIQSSPHFQDKDSVPKIMFTVIIALLPAVAASVYFFRLRAIGLYVSCLLACFVTEAIFLWIRKKPFQSLWDGSVVITGLLLAMTLPPTLSLELAVIGSVVAVAIGKQVFGGLGYNIFNPALVGRAFLHTAFPVAMITWLPPTTLAVDTATYATPLGNLKFQEAVNSDQTAFLGKYRRVYRRDISHRSAPRRTTSAYQKDDRLAHSCRNPPRLDRFHRNLLACRSR